MDEISGVGSEKKSVSAYQKLKTPANQTVATSVEEKIDKKMMDEVTKALFKVLDNAKSKDFIV